MSLNNHKSRSRFGFTLIELLVVVAIIAVLISILLPSLSNARKQAKRLLCQTRMSEMGKAGLMYAMENNDTVVRAEVNLNPWGQELHFASILLPALGYDGTIDNLWRGGSRRNQEFFREVVGKFEVLQCPSFPNSEQDLDFVVSSFPIPYTRASYNQDNGRDLPPGDETRVQNSGLAVAFFKLTSFTGAVSPGDKIYITEAHATVPVADFILHDVFFTSQLPFGAFPRIANDNRHLNQINALFFDGHAESMSFKRMDAGWPEKHQLRLRWFTVLERGEDF